MKILLLSIFYLIHTKIWATYDNQIFSNFSRQVLGAQQDIKSLDDGIQNASSNLTRLNRAVNEVQNNLSNINNIINTTADRVEEKLNKQNKENVEVFKNNLKEENIRFQNKLENQQEKLKRNLENANENNKRQLEERVQRHTSDVIQESRKLTERLERKTESIREDFTATVNRVNENFERTTQAILESVNELARNGLKLTLPQESIDRFREASTASGREIIENGVPINLNPEDIGRFQEAFTASGRQIIADGVPIHLDNDRLKESAQIVGQEIRHGVLGAFDPLIRELSQLMKDGRKRPHIAAVKIAGAVTAIAVSIYASKLAYELMRDYLMTPPLEIKRTDSWWQRLKNKIKGKKAIIPTLDDLKMQPEIKEQLKRYEASLVQGIKSDIELPNAILTGPPGTGKTYAVEAMALKNGLTFVKMSGSSFKKYSKEKALAIMDQLFSWAHRKGGVIIFIDEIENLLSSRESAHSAGDFDILNNFLAHTGTRSKRFALIGTTNVPGLLDAAMGRRFDEMIEFKLPGMAERQQILQGYVKKILQPKSLGINIENNFLKGDFIEKVAQKTDHLAGGELEGIIMRARQVALSTKGKVLQQSIFDKLVDESVTKHNRLIRKTGLQSMAA